MTWKNDLPEGAEQAGPIRVLRFAVARQRGAYFHDLHRRLLDRFEATRGAEARARIGWPEALEEEFIRAQGPVCPGLIEHLRRHGDDYAAVIFLTYLYPTTTDGMRALTHRRYCLVPTLHDEPPAYFGAIRQMARHTPRILWNTLAERRLGERLWGFATGNLVAMTVATTMVEPAQEPTPYLLYSGRIDAHKGCAQLIAGFEAYKRERKSPLRLLLTGSDQLGVQESDDVRYLGFVDEARKFALMAGALAFVHPSPYESLSIVALEAMAQGTPLIVNGECEILADHVGSSDSGAVYRNERELHAAIDGIATLPSASREGQGRRARAYVLANYSEEQVRARLFAEVEALAGE